jgi:hypothetical protein
MAIIASRTFEIYEFSDLSGQSGCSSRADERKSACENVGARLGRSSCGRPRWSWRKEDDMNPLVSRSQGPAWQVAPDTFPFRASGLGRLLVALAIIAGAVGLVDHAAAGWRSDAPIVDIEAGTGR